MMENSHIVSILSASSHMQADKYESRWICLCVLSLSYSLSLLSLWGPVLLEIEDILGKLEYFVLTSSKGFWRVKVGINVLGMYHANKGPHK